MDAIWLVTSRPSSAAATTGAASVRSRPEKPSARESGAALWVRGVAADVVFPAGLMRDLRHPIGFAWWLDLLLQILPLVRATIWSSCRYGTWVEEFVLCHSHAFSEFVNGVHECRKSQLADEGGNIFLDAQPFFGF